MVEKLMLELSKMEEYTGVSIDKIYDALERQANVQIVYNILSIIGVILVVYIGYLASKYCKTKDEESSYYEDWEFWKLISMGFTAFFVIVALFYIPDCIIDIVQIIFNKPIWMLEYLTGLIK